MLLLYAQSASDSLWSIAEDVVNPAEEEPGEVEVVKLLDHLVALNCTEGRAEDNKEDLGEVAW